MNQRQKTNLWTAQKVINDFFGKGQLEEYDQIVAENVCVHCPTGWQDIHDTELRKRKETKKIDQEYAQAFLIENLDSKEWVIGLDKILVQWKCKGFHKGDLFKIPATHGLFSLSGQTLYSFNKDGKIGEVWQSWDMLGLLKQFGYYPTKLYKKPQGESVRILKMAKALTAREKECLKFLLEGRTARETGMDLHVSYRTVEYYFENIKDKLDCSSKKELHSIARFLESNGII